MMTEIYIYIYIHNFIYIYIKYIYIYIYTTRFNEEEPFGRNFSANADIAKYNYCPKIGRKDDAG
jgi:hypothetical protein